MLTSAAVLALAAGCGLTLWLKGRRDHADALRQRAGLLDAALQLFPDGRVTLTAAGFPTLSATLADDRRLRLALIPDTLVFRRLPQLWLQLTIEEARPVRDFAVGALSRPTGAEFYSAVHDLPDWLEPPPGDLPLLLRGRNVRHSGRDQCLTAMAALFADPELKEAVLVPRGVRIIRRASEGDRASHLVLRQVSFPMEAAPCGLIEKVLDDARRVEAAFESQNGMSELAPA